MIADLYDLPDPIASQKIPSFEPYFSKSKTSWVTIGQYSAFDLFPRNSSPSMNSSGVAGISDHSDVPASRMAALSSRRESCNALNKDSLNSLRSYLLYRPFFDPEAFEEPGDRRLLTQESGLQLGP